jgi:hypothetical protein
MKEVGLMSGDKSNKILLGVNKTALGQQMRTGLHSLRHADRRLCEVKHLALWIN